MGEELKPCPFCGAEPFMQEIEPHTHSAPLKTLGMPDHTGSWTIECPTDGCCGMIASTRDEIVANWNRRTAPSRTNVWLKEGCAVFDRALTMEEIAQLSKPGLFAAPSAAPGDAQTNIRAGFEEFARSMDWDLNWHPDYGYSDCNVDYAWVGYMAAVRNQLAAAPPLQISPSSDAGAVTAPSELRNCEKTQLPPAVDQDGQDAKRFRWLAERYTGWDAEWGRDEVNDEPGRAVIVFNADPAMRAPFRRSDLAKSIDAAMDGGAE